MTEEAITAPADPTPIAETPAETPQDAPESGSEAVEAPRAPSARDAIQKAFDTVDKAESDGQPRTPDGKFAKKEGDTTPEVAEKPQDAPKEDPKPDLSDAPSRFSPDAKAAWASADPAIKGEVKRAMSELEKGIAQKDEQLAPLKPFMDMAAKAGTTVEAALSNYVNMENLLKSDPKAGFERIAGNMGMTLPDLLAKVSGTESTATEKDRQILGLQQEINALKGQVGQVSQSFQTQQMTQVESQVTAFAEQNPRFEELAPEIARLLETGYAQDLPTAYQMAEKLNPLQVATPATPAPAQTRMPKSVTGSPSAGSNPATAKPSGTRNEAVMRAFDRAGL